MNSKKDTERFLALVKMGGKKNPKEKAELKNLTKKYSINRIKIAYE